MSSYGTDDSDLVYQGRKPPKRKRTIATRRKGKASAERERPAHILSFDPLLYPPGGSTIPQDDDLAFDETIEDLLPDLLQARLSLQENSLQYDDEGSCLRPLTRSETSSLIDNHQGAHDIFSALITRKMKLSQERRRARVPSRSIVAATNSLTKVQPPTDEIGLKPQVLRALQDIQSTPFENSFLSRLQGNRGTRLPGLIAVDWEVVTPWMSLMRDIRDHYGLAHPDRQQSIEPPAPITYTCLQASHVDQIHDLLGRVFWTGIDVSDSLEYSPERCTVVATYKRLVVGVAILSSPQETYITYLAVRAGWDKAQIARTMLFHLIMLNPKRDITLHVSANSSAMLLYNQFGFKAEEFIVGFYEDYLDSASRASKNAFRLRLRQQ